MHIFKTIIAACFKHGVSILQTSCETHKKFGATPTSGVSQRSDFVSTNIRSNIKTSLIAIFSMSTRIYSYNMPTLKHNITILHDVTQIPEILFTLCKEVATLQVSRMFYNNLAHRMLKSEFCNTNTHLTLARNKCYYMVHLDLLRNY